MSDPEPLLNLSAEEISDRLFTPTIDLPEGVERIPLKAIRTNHVPMLAPAATLKGVDCQRIGLDVNRCLRSDDVHAAKRLDMHLGRVLLTPLSAQPVKRPE